MNQRTCRLGLYLGWLMPWAVASSLHAHDRVPHHELAVGQEEEDLPLYDDLAGDEESETEAPAPSQPAPESKASSDLKDIVWRASQGRKPCRRYRGRRFYCDGPLKVPKPSGAAGDLAEQLHIGTTSTAGTLLNKAPNANWVAAAPEVTSTDLVWPVQDGRLLRGFGKVRQRYRKKPHQGVDIGAPPGTSVVAANDGLVAYSHNGLRGYGNLLILVHGDGSTTFYAHLRAAYVFAGQRVQKGQVIGEVGQTGLARGPHLHFEWHLNGKAADPMPQFHNRSERVERKQTPIKVYSRRVNHRSRSRKNT